MTFNPDAPAEGDGVFGLPTSREKARVVMIPVPFEATTSYRRGTAEGPAAIRRASAQVDLFDGAFGRIYEHGLFMEDADPAIADLSHRASSLAAPIIRRGGSASGDEDVVAEIDFACGQVNEIVHRAVANVLREGKVPGVIGGEHAVSFGAIRACAERHPGLGILQIDAHMDLRPRYEGFQWSHASVLRNVMDQIPTIGGLVQVGIRDFAEGERKYAQARPERIVTFYDDDVFAEAAHGLHFGIVCDRILAALPQTVYVTFDIDGLDPSLCPHTGTPVPGGLSFREAAMLLHRLAVSGRRVVGFDLVEVCPGPGAGQIAPEWDANVGARILYKLCGAAGSAR